MKAKTLDAIQLMQTSKMLRDETSCVTFSKRTHPRRLAKK